MADFTNDRDARDDARLRGRGPPAVLRLFYAAGPGDIIGTYRHWKQGEDDPSEPVVPTRASFTTSAGSARPTPMFSRPVLVAISFATAGSRSSIGRIAGRNARGVRFHLAQFWYGLRLVVSALRFRPGHGDHQRGRALVPAARCSVGPACAWCRRLHVRLDWQDVTALGCGESSTVLNSRFFRRHCAAVLVASRQIAEDVQVMAGSRRPPLLEFLPLYRRAMFAGIRPADHDRRPFNVLFVGRVEANKGVFDLLEAAATVWARCDDVQFHVCGVGSALEELQARVRERRLGERFHMHGYCDRARLSRHVRSCLTWSWFRPGPSFGEGFNQVTAEAVLAGRPVITSSVCPGRRVCAGRGGRGAARRCRRVCRGCRAAGQRCASFYARSSRPAWPPGSSSTTPDRSWGAAVRQVLAQAFVTQKKATPRPARSHGVGSVCLNEADRAYRSNAPTSARPDRTLLRAVDRHDRREPVEQRRAGQRHAVRVQHVVAGGDVGALGDAGIDEVVVLPVAPVDVGVAAADAEEGEVAALDRQVA